VSEVPGAPAADRYPGTAALKAEALACRRGGRLLLEAVDWHLEPGDALHLAGANGTGKSSLLRLIAGYLAPAGGRLAYGTGDVFADLAQWQSRVHCIGYQDALKPALSVEENLGFVAMLLGDGSPDRLDEALSSLDLLALRATSARFLSSGQRRRVALARLVAVPRPVWLLDEPGVGLDAANRARLEALIDEHRRRGGIAVVASHGDVTLATAYCLDLDG